MLHVEHLVIGVVIVHHVKTRTNIGGVRSLGHKFQGDLVSFGRYTVGASVLLVGTLNDTLFRASGFIGAQLDAIGVTNDLDLSINTQKHAHRDNTAENQPTHKRIQ